MGLGLLPPGAEGADAVLLWSPATVCWVSFLTVSPRTTGRRAHTHTFGLQVTPAARGLQHSRGLAAPSAGPSRLSTAVWTLTVPAGPQPPHGNARAVLRTTDPSETSPRPASWGLPATATTGPTVPGPLGRCRAPANSTAGHTRVLRASHSFLVKMRQRAFTSFYTPSAGRPGLFPGPAGVRCEAKSRAPYSSRGAPWGQSGGGPAGARRPQASVAGIVRDIQPQRRARGAGREVAAQGVRRLLQAREAQRRPLRAGRAWKRPPHGLEGADPSTCDLRPQGRETRVSRTQEARMEEGPGVAWGGWWMGGWRPWLRPSRAHGSWAGPGPLRLRAQPPPQHGACVCLWVSDLRLPLGL